MMLEHPMLAAAIHSALAQHRPGPSLADVPSRNPYDLTIALSLLMVAVDQQGKVVAVLMALPPVRVLGQFLQAGFTVLDPHQGIDFSGLASFPLNVLPLGGEQLFVRWLNNDTQIGTSR